MLTILTRRKGAITIPDFVNAKTGGDIEGDLFGLSNSDIILLVLDYAMHL